MTVNCEPIVEAACNRQASEGNQVVDDSSAKTIEFLRARLLAERAASKLARQQAQETSEKLKDLHSRLERETELRKAAEAALEKVFAVLKAKGVVDGISLAIHTDTQAPSKGGTSPVDHWEETKETPEKASSETVDVSVQGGVTCSVDNRIKARPKGILECTTVGAREFHMMESAVGVCNITNAPSIDAVERKGGDALSSGLADNRQCVTDQVQDVIKEVVHRDHDTPDCNSDIEKDMGTGQSIECGLSVPTKLKAMFQQIEEEVGALPEDLPLKLELQGWVSQAANMLDRGQEADLSVCLEILHSSGRKQLNINCPSEAITSPETKNIQQWEVDASLVDKSGLQPAKLLHGMAGAERSALPVHNAQLQQRQLRFHTSTTGKDTPLRSNMSYQRHPCCNSLYGGTMAACVPHDPLSGGPWSAQMSQYDNSGSEVPCPLQIPCSLRSTGNNVGSESSYFVEVPSLKRFDVLSVEAKMGYAYEQHNECHSPARALPLERQNAWSQARTGRQYAYSPARVSTFEGQNAWPLSRLRGQPKAMLTDGCFVTDTANYESNLKFEAGSSHQKIHLKGAEHSFPQRAHSHQARDVRSYSLRGAGLQPKGLFPSRDAALSVMDDRNGRLGGILMALDAARQHIQDDELMGPPTPTRSDPRLRRGYGYGDSLQQLASSELQRDICRSRSSRMPIIQFPPSPTSEHGYSPFDRPCGAAHQRSNSLSTNIMMSGWDNSLQQPRGEVELGNGITLFTD